MWTDSNSEYILKQLEVIHTGVKAKAHRIYNKLTGKQKSLKHPRHDFFQIGRKFKKKQ